MSQTAHANSEDGFFAQREDAYDNSCKLKRRQGERTQGGRDGNS